MNSITRNWRVVIGGLAAGSAALIGFAGASASADPDAPVVPVPAPATVTQTVTVTPQAVTTAAPAATPAAAPAAAAADPATALTPSVAATPAITPAAAGTLAEFFAEKGVTLEPQKAAEFTALNIVLPMPTGWTVVPDPNVPDAFTVIADRKGGDALYTPNAQLKVYKLTGDFDPREAISHGFVDSQLLQNWQGTAGSMDYLGAFPSSIIEGTYREGDVTLNTSRRHVIAEAGEDRYLVSLYVTTSASQVVATAPATEGIIKGFKVSVPSATPVPAAPAAPAAPGAPAAPAAAPAIDAAGSAAAAPVAPPAAAAPAVPAAAQ